MSKGMGIVQRRILAALSARAGGDRTVSAYQYGCVLAPGIHDMRAVRKTLARDHGGLTGSYVSEKWSASFSRAVAGLAARGLLEFPPLVQVVLDETGRAERLADGDYIHQPRRRRFTVLGGNS